MIDQSNNRSVNYSTNQLIDQSINNLPINRNLLLIRLCFGGWIGSNIRAGQVALRGSFGRPRQIPAAGRHQQVPAAIHHQAFLCPSTCIWPLYRTCICELFSASQARQQPLGDVSRCPPRFVTLHPPVFLWPSACIRPLHTSRIRERFCASYGRHHRQGDISR